MIELKRTDSSLTEKEEVQATAERMLQLLLDVLQPLDPDPGASPKDASLEASTSRTVQAQTPETDVPSTQDKDAVGDLLQRLMNQDRPPGPHLTAVSDTTQQETLHTWTALQDLFDRLGPGRLAAIEQQTDIHEIPADVLQAIEMHLDDERLSSLGKVLAIGHLLLGQAFPHQ